MLNMQLKNDHKNIFFYLTLKIRNGKNAVKEGIYCNDKMSLFFRRKEYIAVLCNFRTCRQILLEMCSLQNKDLPVL